MSQSIRISDELYAMANSSSKSLSRPIAQQMEYWARLGAALDAVGLSSASAMRLLGDESGADKFVNAALHGGVEVDGSLRSLNLRHKKNATDVASGKKKARSLFFLTKKDLENFQFENNSKSEFSRSGTGW